MLLAIWDYYQYRQRRGRYSDLQSDGGMAMAFVDEIPEDQIRQFRDHDMVFTQRLDSFLSWAMMYVTSSPVDHVGVFNNGKVLHKTLSGARLHSIRAFSRGCRVLIVRMSRKQLSHFMYETEAYVERIDRGSPWLHSLPPKAQIAIGGIKSIHGKYADRFRWPLWAEWFFTSFIASALIWYVSGYITSFILPILSVSALLYFWTVNLYRKISGSPALTMSHPDLHYRTFFKVGGLMFTKMGPLAISQLGIFPLKVVLGFARQRTDNGPDDDFEKARKFFSDLSEGWDVVGFSEEAKNDDGYQHDKEQRQKGP
jgi:hypothetical protein